MRANALPPEQRQKLLSGGPTIGGDLLTLQNYLSTTVKDGPLDASVMLRKGIYDKVAAQVILQRYLDFYNSEEDILKVDTDRKTTQKQLPAKKMQPP